MKHVTCRTLRSLPPLRCVGMKSSPHDRGPQLEPGMSEKNTQDMQDAAPPTGADLQEQRDILEAGIRLALAALAQGDVETAQAELEEALRRSTSATAPQSDIGPLP